MTEKKIQNKSTKELRAEYNSLKLSLQREKEKKRKARTRRLIRKGALLEKVFELQDFSVEETEKFLNEIYNKLN